MAENGKPKAIGLKIWLILATVITALVSVVGVLASIAWFLFGGIIYSVVFVILFLGNPYLSILAWRHYRAGNRQLVVIFSIIITIVSIINSGIIIFIFWDVVLSNYLNWLFSLN